MTQRRDDGALAVEHDTETDLPTDGPTAHALTVHCPVRIAVRATTGSRGPDCWLVTHLRPAYGDMDGTHLERRYVPVPILSGSPAACPAR